MCAAFSAEYRIIRPDGMMRWVEVRGETECNATTGQPSQFVGVMVDVTERKEREAQFRALTELAPQFVWLAEAEGQMTYANSTVSTTSYVSVICGSASSRPYRTTCGRRSPLPP